MFKRFLAFTLVMVMVISGLAMNVNALKVEYVDVEDADIAEALDILSQLEVVKGIGNDKFGGELDVTRAQFALFVARISTGFPEYFVVKDTDDAAALWNVIQPIGADGEKKCTDVDPVRDKAYLLGIAHCYKEGIVQGRDLEGKVFDPNGTITFAEAVTMLVRALNYTGLSYPTGFLTKASLGGRQVLAYQLQLGVLRPS